MKICFLGPALSAHIIKWCGYFSARGHEVYVVSFTKGEIPGVTVRYVNSGADGGSSDAKKLNYLLKAGAVRRAVREIRPDIVNAHYATSYGTVAALAGLEDYVVSVWGSDVYAFPKKSPLHRALLQYSLRKAPHLFSTSQAMADEASRYTNKHFDITPFGVDTELFSPRERDPEKRGFVVGTIKGLSYQYGIDCLLQAAAILRKEHPEIPLKLRIAGKGPDEAALKQLAEELGLSDCVTWLGFISQEQAAKEWADMDLAVVTSSAQESFGVSAVEAQACACPIIVSDVSGLMEATMPGVTSVVVPRRDERALASAICGLYRDPDRRREMGARGRQFVVETYEYRHCFEKIEGLFESIMESRK